MAIVAAAGDYDTATSGPVDFNITPATTTASLTANQSSSFYGTSLTFTATISASGSVANVPTGLVTFWDGSAVLATEMLDGSGVAAFTTSLLSVGDNVITAVYAGDKNFSGTSSNTLTQLVSLATMTWSGGGADAKWSTAANWAGDVAPLAGDNLVFPVAAANFDNINDYPSGTQFGSITVFGTGYIFHNGISSTTNVQVPTGTMTVDSIVADTLTIGTQTLTWNGGGTDNNWSTAANWLGGVAPLPGDNLVFPAGAVNR